MKKLLLLLLILFPLTSSAAIFQVVQGGTGVGTLSGIPFGNGTSPFSVLTIGTGLSLVGSTLNATGGGGGSSGGTWSTTTSQTAGQFINYPNNSTDIVNIGSTSTTTGKFYFDPNLVDAFLTNVRIGNSTTTNATTTNSFVVATDGVVGAPAIKFGVTLSGGLLPGAYDNSGGFGISAAGTGITYTGTALTPNTDNLRNLGSASQRWLSLFAVNPTFTGSSTLQVFTATNSTTTNATTTAFAISSILSKLLKTDGNGSVIPAVAGTDYQAVITPAALTKTDDTNVTLTLGGSPSTALLSATSLTLGWTGTLADSRVADNLTISGGTVDNSVIGGTTKAAGSFTNLLALASSTLQNFTALNSTSTNATTTSIAATTICFTGDTCRTTWPSGGSSASSTLLTDNNGFSGLNTFTDLKLVTRSTTTNATTTNLSIATLFRSGTTDGCATWLSGILGTTGTACGSGSGGSSYPFPLTGNATSTLTQFNGGLTAFATSTIGDGTNTGGLTVNGPATSTYHTLLPNASPTYRRGALYYDTGSESLTFFNNDSAIGLQIGQEQWVQVNNASGSTIANGAAVKITGASGGLPTIALVQGTSADVPIGLTTESIANGAIGYVTVNGIVHGLDTSAFSAGAVVYVSTSVAGGLTTTVPSAPNYRMRIGVVGVSNAVTGTIYVAAPTSALGFGSADQLLGMNSGGTAQEYKSILSNVSTASSTVIGNLVISGNSTTTNSTTTKASIATASTTNLRIDTAKSALLLTNGTGDVSGYAAQACTNQFVRGLSALGVPTCATVGATDVALANLTATDATLTFSGTYNGSTARTIGINLGNANTWTALQTFSNANAILATGSTTLQNLTFVNATGTSATTTNFFATTASSTNLFSSLATIGTNSALVVNSLGNTGVGVSALFARLETKGTTTDATAFGEAVWDSSNAMTFGVRNDGHVAIGATTTPYAVLSVNAPATTLPLFAIGSTTSNGGSGLVESHSYTPYASIGAGTTTLNAEFAFQASTSAAGLFNNEVDIASSTSATAADSHFRITQTGKIFAPQTLSSGSSQTSNWCADAAGQFIRDSAACLISALRFKKDVEPLTLGLNDLLKLRPVTYYKKDPLDATDSHMQMGFIADEVASTSPALNELLVTYSDGGTSGEVHGFRYDQFTALLTKSIQELDQKVEGTKRSMEEDWQDIFIGLLILGFAYQQWQIKKLKS